MNLSVLPNSPIPAYRQLYDQIAHQILSGTLKAGTSLPPIRTVSKELGVSVITVRNAWDALIADGLIESKAGSGCFVASLKRQELESRREEALNGPFDELIEKAKVLGFTKEELIKAIEEKY